MMRRDSKPLVFLHIPKTGGTTLQALLAYHFHPAEIAHVPDEESLNSELVGRLAGTHRFIHGHVNYASLEPLTDRIDYMCFLREPVSRVLSTYYFLREQSPHHAASDDTRRLIEYAARLPLQDFLLLDDPIVTRTVRNLQCYSLTGEPHPSASVLAKAKSVLGRACFVGIMERYAESMLLLGSLMGWPPSPVLPVLNPGDRTKRSAQADETARALCTEMNAADVELYESACSQFAENFRQADCTPRAWRRRVSHPERYRGVQTALGQVTDLSRPILGTGWHAVEGIETGRPWRFAAFGPTSTVHCLVEPEPGTELWALSYVPFFAPGARADDIKILVNGHHPPTNCLILAQGVAFLSRITHDQLEPDGLQAFAFDSSLAQIDWDMLRHKLQDDRPVRFALSRILLLQFSPAEHPRFTRRLLQVVLGLANPEPNNPYAEFLQELADRARQQHQYQPRTDSAVTWCTPLYQRNRLRLLEQHLPGDIPTQTSQSLQQLYDADPVLVAELLFFLYPHIEPAR